jgi:hypothetical protein
MVKILWHRRENRRKTEKTNFDLLSRETPVYSKVTWKWLLVEKEPTESGQAFLSRV